MPLVLLALYCLPIFIAWRRKHPSIGAIAVITLLLGWTVIGWIVALAMAAGRTDARAIVAAKAQPAPSIIIENIVGDHNSISRRESITASGQATSSGRAPRPLRQCSEGHPVALGTKFCPDCGVLVAKTCSNGHALADTMKFCGECGAAAGALPSGTL